MIIYEVNLRVRAEIADPFAAWLRHHIPEVVAAGQFTGARWSEADAQDTQDARLWCVQYEVPSRPHLARYLQDHAPRLRQDGLDRFGDQFSATRRVLEVRQRWDVA